MKTETVIEVVQALTGCCYPYGDTYEDEKRIQNLGLKMDLFKFLLDEIEEASHLRNRPEWSIKQISNEAYEFLVDTKAFLDVVLGETE